jgi:hypothetical protein
MSGFKPTAKQQEAQLVIAGDATHAALGGGSRSGKTYLHVRNVVMRAIKAPGSRHAILRFRFNHCKISIVHDTFPKVMAECFPEVRYRLDKTDWYVEFLDAVDIDEAGTEKRSQIWFGGLDDKERTEKILGQEYATIFVNECSQITYSSLEILRTRLAQRVHQVINGQRAALLKPRMFYDFNPPGKGHWTYKVFIKKIDPESGKPLARPENYVYFRINPEDNKANQAEGYIETLKEMSAAKRRRFLEGEFQDENPDALFNEDTIEKWRDYTGDLPKFVRVLVGVDPSGADENRKKEVAAENDEIGIAVGALGADGKAYLLEDCSLLTGPAGWGAVATTAYDRHEANAVVGEVNYGGAMVRHVVQTARPNTPFKAVTATRGKAIRAEPFSALYEQGKVVHVGKFPKLEEELCNMTTHGYIGTKSPNRADAWIWILADLFPSMVAEKKDKEKKPPYTPRRAGGTGAVFGRR